MPSEARPGAPATAFRETAEGCSIQVKVTPRSRREELSGVDAPWIRVRLTAPAIEGRANQALLELLSRALGIAGARLQIASGASSRQKVVRVRGVSAAEAAARLRGAATTR